MKRARATHTTFTHLRHLTELRVQMNAEIEYPHACPFERWSTQHDVTAAWFSGEVTLTDMRLSPLFVYDNYKEQLYLGECVDADSDPQGTWHHTRIGPFVSKGGFDWWLFLWSHVMGLPAGSRIDAAYFSGMDLSGHPILLPPLHSHHTHVTPVNADVNIAVLMEQHGDWIPAEPKDWDSITDLHPDYCDTGGIQTVAISLQT